MSTASTNALLKIEGNENEATARLNQTLLHAVLIRLHYITLYIWLQAESMVISGHIFVHCLNCY